MRLRTTVAAALGALALVVTLPGSASAAQGDFTYTYTAQDGSRQQTGLINPPSRQCITLPGAADPGRTLPADTPWNNTDATATVFTGPDCDGDYFTLRPDGGHASSRLKLRSVVFS